jgi:hypothetical protein
MTTEVETITTETVEKVNEWLRNATTKHGNSVYRPFVLEEPHYAYTSSLQIETPAGNIYARITSHWESLCWNAREGDEADDDGLASDWFFQFNLSLTPTGPKSPFEHPADDNPMVAVVRDYVVAWGGVKAKLIAGELRYQLHYYIRGEVRRIEFRENERPQLVKSPTE